VLSEIQLRAFRRDLLRELDLRDRRRPLGSDFGLAEKIAITVPALMLKRIDEEVGGSSSSAPNRRTSG